MTRSGLALMKGQWQNSLYNHALLIPTVVFILCHMVGKTKSIKNKHLVAMLAVVLGYYLIRMLILFPHTPPMAYQENNIINTIFEHIHKP